MDMKAFITLPLYHNHGICNFFRAIYSGRSIHIYNADLPLTQPYLATILRKHNFEIFYGVPYALKLLAETDEGIELLKQLKIVMYGGSACPDTLGDLLVEKGVNLVGHYGACVSTQHTSTLPLANTYQYRSRAAHDIFPPQWRQSLELCSRISKAFAFSQMGAARYQPVRMYGDGRLACEGSLKPT